METMKLGKAFTLLEPGPVVLEGVAAYFDSARREQRTIHAMGDGTFMVDGRKLDRKKTMRSKVPEGV